MDQTAKKKYKQQKIDTYVSLNDVNRLRSICKKYGFDSIYQLLKYLVDCFLRVADPANDDKTEPVPQAIEEMFISPREYHRMKRLAKKDKQSKKFEIQLLIPFGEFLSKKTKRLIINEQGMQMANEIEEMFASQEAWQTDPNSNAYHEGMSMQQKPDQRKYRTPDDLK